MPKLLVSVVNYCDPEFYHTVKSLWETASIKDDLIFSLVSEDVFKYTFDFIPKNQLIYKHFDTSIYRGGVCWARNMAVDVEVEYDYLIQFDSHTLGSPDWDKRAIESYCSIEGSRHIISYAPADYEITEDQNFEVYDVPRPYSSKATCYAELIPGFKFPGYEKVPEGKPVISYWVTCCYLLAPKSWVDEVGIDKKSSFNTEEFCLSLRTFYKGWKIYAVQSRDVFHHDSHRQPNGTVTRQTNRPWADGKREDYWSHVNEATDFLGRLMAGHEDVPVEAVKAFSSKTGMPKPYTDCHDDYKNYIVIPNRAYGMPPRRDY